MGLFGKANRIWGNSLDHKTRHHGRDAAHDIADAASDANAQLRSLLDELEKALSDGASLDADKLRSQLQMKLDAARSRFGDTGSRLARDLGHALDNADDLVRSNPWQTIAAVAGIALLAGFFAARS
jgi:ElaB/YqjD/DUF883 family membrane-anchored ribosome-binding protein